MTLDELRKELIWQFSKQRAAEAGGCFYAGKGDGEQGECADGDCYCYRQCELAADRALSVVKEAGFALVPREPTEVMLNKIYRGTHVINELGKHRYAAMLKAAEEG